MKQIIVLVAVFTVVFIASTTAPLAQGNTVQFGVDKAYLYDGGKVRIPVILNNSDGVGAFGWIFEFFPSGGPIKLDSLVISGRTLAVPNQDTWTYWHMSRLYDVRDTICLFFNLPFTDFPPGNGVISEMWLSGGIQGETIEILPLDTNESRFCHIPSGSGFQTFVEGGTVTGTFLPSTLTVVTAAPEFTVADSVSAQTAIPVTIPVAIKGAGSSFSLSVVSLIGPGGAGAAPVISGQNPFQVSWTPPLTSVGSFSMTLRATDSFGQTTDKSIVISTVGSAPQGDTDCNGLVDISDLARLVAYLTGGGAVPVCPGRTK